MSIGCGNATNVTSDTTVAFSFRPRTNALSGQGRKDVRNEWHGPDGKRGSSTFFVARRMKSVGLLTAMAVVVCIRDMFVTYW